MSQQVLPMHTLYSLILRLLFRLLVKQQVDKKAQHQKGRPVISKNERKLNKSSRELHSFRDFQMGTISQSVCSWQVFPAQCNVKHYLIVPTKLKRKRNVVNAVPGVMLGSDKFSYDCKLIDYQFYLNSKLTITIKHFNLCQSHRGTQS